MVKPGLRGWDRGDIECFWEELESDLEEAETLIKWFSSSYRYAAQQNRSELPTAPVRLSDTACFPESVALAYVFEGDSIFRAWRKHQRLTIEEVARRSGICSGRLFRLERTGVISASERDKLAKVFDVAPQGNLGFCRQQQQVG